MFSAKVGVAFTVRVSVDALPKVVFPFTVRLPEFVWFPVTDSVPEREALVPETVPVKVGEFENTSDPVPVSSVTADERFADDGVPRKVATPVPSPDTPVEIGRFVASVRLNAGVASVPPSERVTPP